MEPREEADRDVLTAAPPREGDPLAELGLIDIKTGIARETEDYTPDRRALPGSDEPTFTERDGGWPDTTGPGQTDKFWDREDNPYKKQYEDLRRQIPQAPPPEEQARNELMARDQLLRQQALEARNWALSQRTQDGKPVYDPDVVDQMIGMIYAKELSEAKLQAFQVAGLPWATRSAAEKIAKHYSTGNAKVKPDDLMGESSVAAMDAKARAIVEYQRDHRYERRQAQRLDVVEGGPAAGNRLTQAYESLEPEQKIRLGITRGD